MNTERGPSRTCEDLQKEGSIELLKQLLATVQKGRHDRYFVPETF